MLTYVLGAALAAVLAYGAGNWLFKKDTEVENQRRAANKLAGVLRSQGLEKVPAFLEDYGVGDYSGMATRIKNLVELFGDPDSVIKEFSKVFENVLKAKLADPAGRALIQAQLAATEKPAVVEAVAVTSK
jgi:hypothetical protein